MTGLQPLIISAPFGNYIQPAGCTATLGTFTAAARPGRLWRIAKTVRYYPRLQAWVNKIGLRNPGIGWVKKKNAAGKLDLSDKLVSVHGFTPDDWWMLLDEIATLKPMGVELNMSCPNVGEIDWPEGLFERAVNTGVPVVVKLPPVNYITMAKGAVDAGVTWLHCCNTLPVPAGGVSGRPLKPVALQCIADLRQQPWMQNINIIGGGGIRGVDDIDQYRSVGASHFAVGTYTMNPMLLLTHRRLVPLHDHAASVQSASTK